MICTLLIIYVHDGISVVDFYNDMIKLIILVVLFSGLFVLLTLLVGFFFLIFAKMLILSILIF